VHNTFSGKHKMECGDYDWVRDQLTSPEGYEPKKIVLIFTFSRLILCILNAESTTSKLKKQTWK
jgi:hypothetical protein